MEPVVGRKRWAIQAVVLTIAFMTNVDASIVNIAIPVISEKLNVTTAATTWVVTVYLLGFTSFILFFGKIADIVGKRRVFLTGLAVFTAGSLLCGLPLALPWLLVSRVLQAIGAGISMSSTLGITAEVFPENERGRALGFAGMAVALGNITGPTIGGLILSFLDWHYIFLINVPIGIVALSFGIKLIPNDNKKADSRTKLDFPGFTAFALSIITLFVALSQAEVDGFSQPYIPGLIAAAVVLFALFVVRERRTAFPMLDLSIFRNGLFSLSILCTFLAYWAISCSPLILPMYLQDMLGLEPHVTGFIILASPLVMVAVAPVSGYLSDKIGAAILTFIGLTILASSFVMMGLLLTQSTPIFVIVLLIAFSAFGGGMFTSPNTVMVMSSVPKGKYGIAGSVNTLVRNAGTTCSVAISSIILYNRISASIGYRVSTIVLDRPDTFAYALRWVYLVTAGICTLGAAMTGIRLFGRKSPHK